jgi:hypothetical protein
MNEDMIKYYQYTLNQIKEGSVLNVILGNDIYEYQTKHKYIVHIIGKKNKVISRNELIRKIELDIRRYKLKKIMKNI